LLDASKAESEVGPRVDMLLRRTCAIARALTGAEQAALKLWVDQDPGQARKYFSLSEKYERYRDFRVDPRGFGAPSAGSIRVTVPSRRFATQIEPAPNAIPNGAWPTVIV
jgi:hypothetical protein